MRVEVEARLFMKGARAWRSRGLAGRLSPREGWTMAQTTCEVWVLVDAQGDYATGTDEDGAKERYVETIGSLEESNGFRLYKLALHVPLPAVLELEGEVPDDEGEMRLALSKCLNG